MQQLLAPDVRRLVSRSSSHHTHLSAQIKLTASTWGLAAGLAGEVRRGALPSALRGRSIGGPCYRPCVGAPQWALAASTAGTPPRGLAVDSACELRRGASRQPCGRSPSRVLIAGRAWELHCGTSSPQAVSGKDRWATVWVNPHMTASEMWAVRVNYAGERPVGWQRKPAPLAYPSSLPLRCLRSGDCIQH